MLPIVCLFLISHGVNLVLPIVMYIVGNVFPHDVCVFVYVSWNMWKPEDNCMEMAVSFHSSVGSENQTQVARLERQVPLPSEPSPPSTPISCCPFLSEPISSCTWHLIDLHLNSGILETNVFKTFSYTQKRHPQGTKPTSE